METMNNNTNAANNVMNTTTRTDIYQIDPRNIVVVDGFNARREFDLEELKEQIREYGMLVPITVVPFKDENGVEKYRLVDGERRYRSVMALLDEGVDIKRIKAMYLPKNTKEEDMYIQQMVKNTGKAFNEMEMGIFFQMFKDKFGYTQNEIAEKFCKKPSFVSRCLALLDVAPEIQERMQKGEISTDAVRNILKQSDDEKEQISAVENAVNDAKAKGKRTATTKNISPSLQVANIVTKMRKDMLKVVGMLDNLTDPNAAELKAFFNELYENTNEVEYKIQHLDNVQSLENIA